MSDAPQEFEKLQKLLKLKRYELPPPGYFNRFSSRVVSRIEAERERSSVWDQARWLRQFLTMLETNPLAAGGFGIAICGLLISGIVYSQHRTPDEFSAESAPSVNMASSGAPEWGRTERVDSTIPSINSSFTTNAPNALFGFGGLEKVSVQQVNFNP